MKAMVYTKCGSPDGFRLTEVEKPAPTDDEVLVKVHAASINSWDWDLLRGSPFLTRLIYFAFLKPKYKILGADIAGQVEAVGSNVKQLQPGDAVFGDISGCGWGGFAEYVSVPENAVALKSAGMTFDQAAAVPQAAVLALQGLRDNGQVHKGQKVLINGAGGGVGTFAVQMAKFFGTEVTGVDSGEKLDMLRSLGADHVIDYRQEDFTKNGQRYDLILDVVANRRVFDYRDALNPKGVFAMVGGSTALIFQLLFLGSWISKRADKKMGVVMHQPNQTDLNFITELFESGKVVPVIDKRYPLHELPDAFRYFGEGRAQGKVVITMEGVVDLLAVPRRSN